MVSDLALPPLLLRLILLLKSRLLSASRLSDSNGGGAVASMAPAPDSAEAALMAATCELERDLRCDASDASGRVRTEGSGLEVACDSAADEADGGSA